MVGKLHIQKHSRTFFSLNSVKKPRITELSLEGQIRKIFKEDAEIAIKIAKAESGMNCQAVSPRNKDGTRDHGLFQLNDRYHRPEYDCLENIKKAKKIKDQWQNFHAWTTYKKIYPSINY